MSDKTDAERLAFLLEGDVYVTEKAHGYGYLVFRHSQWDDDDRIGEGTTPREAIDNAIDNAIAEESRRRAEADEAFRRRFPGSSPGS